MISTWLLVVVLGGHKRIKATEAAWQQYWSARFSGVPAQRH